MKRRFLIVLPLFLLIVPLMLLACGGGGSDAKSPFEILSDRVASLEAKVANLDNVSPSDVKQLRLDLDAIVAQVGGANGTEAVDSLLTDFADLVVRVDGLENGSIPGEEGLYCRPLNMMFLAETGGANPDPQTLVVTLPVDTSWYAFEGEGWLAIAPTAGAEPTVVTVSVDITDLATGVYYGNIAVITVSEVVEVSVTLGVLDFPSGVLELP